MLTILSSDTRLLLVEDIHAMRMLVRQMLRTLGITQVIEANDGSSALQNLREQPVDLILSDWNMVPMTGLQLLMAVREMPALQQVPFIMITGERAASHVGHARRWGVNGYQTVRAGPATVRSFVRWKPGPPEPNPLEGETATLV